MHGNSKENPKSHHLYEIFDKEQDDVFKYGISDNSFGADGLSKRIRRQLSLMNTIAGLVRYFANILLRDIPGKREASKIEDEHIEAYRQKFGHPPRGNPGRQKNRLQ